MKVLATAGIALALGCLIGTDVSAKSVPTKPWTNPGVITISCFRGPTSDVIWDRPNAVFVEDLVKVGYTYPEAHAIGERVCRDEYGVGQHEYLRSTLLEIMRMNPPKP